MKYLSLYDFDLYIFDFDGTIMNTEPLHYSSYCEVLYEMLEERNLLHSQNIMDDFTYHQYEKVAHSIDLQELKYYLKYHFKLDNYEEFYQRKQKRYSEKIREKDVISFCEGMHSFLSRIIHLQKEFVIVTNSSMKHLQHFLEDFPILQKASKIYTKEIIHHKKPHPEGYLRVLQDFPQEKYPHKIGFEDSMRGLHSLLQVKSIIPVFINSSEYAYFDKIDPKSCYKMESFHLETEMRFAVPLKHHAHEAHIFSMIDHYAIEIQKNRNEIKRAIEDISVIIRNRHPCSHVYLTGMGKSGYVCKKSASTWQSLSLPCTYLDLPNLPHGDFGILKENDIIIFISNSGNTEEIVWILKYLKNHFHKKIFTISLIAQQNSLMEKLSDFSYLLQPITEADEIQMTPSISSSLFMMTLDMIGIYARTDVTKDEFKMNHPAGSLGKK